jgi:hypothetical protein
MSEVNKPIDEEHLAVEEAEFIKRRRPIDSGAGGGPQSETAPMVAEAEDFSGSKETER